MLAYKAIGDIGEATAILLSIVYAACVAYFVRDGSFGFFDQSWANQGFCIKNHNVPFESSFDYCVYPDIPLALLLLILYMSWKDTRGMARANEITFATVVCNIGHGLVHGIQAYGIRRGERALEFLDIATSFAFFIFFMIFFWMPFSKALIHQLTWFQAALLSVALTYCQTFFDSRFIFVYAQSVIYLLLGVGQLLRPMEEKECFEYALFSTLVTFPAVLVSWIESIYCSAFFRVFGGHVLFDLTNIIPYATFYIVCYWKASIKSSKAKIE